MIASNKFYKNKLWLEDQYINQRKSGVEMAELILVNSSTIYRWLKKFDILIRSQIEAQKIAQGKPEIKIKHSKGNKGKKRTKAEKKKMSQSRTGKNSHNWHGGKFKSISGYVHIYKPNHPRANGNTYVREHILIIEEILGRPLKYFGRGHKDNEIIHHINFNRSDNRIENLYIRSSSKHRKLHSKFGNMTIKLYELGIIYFDKNKGEYFLNENIIIGKK